MKTIVDDHLITLLFRPDPKVVAREQEYEKRQRQFDAQIKKLHLESKSGRLKLEEKIALKRQAAALEKERGKHRLQYFDLIHSAAAI